MAYAVMKCQIPKFSRLLYYLYVNGVQRLYCSLCGGVTVLKIGDGEVSDEED